MEYSLEMGSGTMIYLPGYIQVGLSIQKLFGGGYIYRLIDSKDDFIRVLFIFFRIRKWFKKERKLHVHNLEQRKFSSVIYINLYNKHTA
jgi:hypothetical protein